MPPSPESPNRSVARGYLKRGTDLVIGSLLLLLAAPIIVMSAAAIRIDSRGPAFFRQVRIGRGGRPFSILKLRTMRHGSETGSDITVAVDTRVTRAGRYLRHTRIDELPQLWNVVRGDMSLVGPRPEQPRIVADYPPDWAPLLGVRPGLTDEATLAFRNEASLLGHEATSYERVVLPAKARISLDGVLNRQSVVEDLSILARTAGIVTGVFRPKEHPEVVRIRELLAHRSPQKET
jgi:lipopolysaccharide/colanic/teichoic acid biosynthesis glycosyltransferase